jgi:hypothetical protein
MAEITIVLLEVEKANLVIQRDEAERRARTADGAIQMLDALLAVLAQEPDLRVPETHKLETVKA